MTEYLKIVKYGKLHSGIDDAINIANIIQNLRKEIFWTIKKNKFEN